MKLMNEVEEAVRTAVCADCLSPGGIGPCGCGQWKDCPLNRFLPQAIDAVNAGKSPSLIDYFRGLLLSTKDQAGELFEGSRMPANDAEWFERFLPVIAEAVEDVKGRHLPGARPNLAH